MLNPLKPTNWQSYLWVAARWQKFTHGGPAMANVPVLGDFTMPGMVLQEKYFDTQWIPINKRLEDSESTVIPLNLLKELIGRTAHRVILHQCPCRQGYGCTDYPKDIGCIYLGDATKDLDPSFGRHASVKEALEHTDKAVKFGLVPIVGQIDFDALLLGCTPADHFCTVCFCDPCCCVNFRFSTAYHPRYREKLMHRLEGLSVTVTDSCAGCGECEDKCFVGAISMKNDRAVIDQKYCKGCGVCVENCPVDAISIEVTDGNGMKKTFFERIESRVDLYSSIPGKEVNTKARGQIPHPRHGFNIPKYKHSRE